MIEKAPNNNPQNRSINEFSIIRQIKTAPPFRSSKKAISKNMVMTQNNSRKRKTIDRV